MLDPEEKQQIRAEEQAKLQAALEPPIGREFKLNCTPPAAQRGYGWH